MLGETAALGASLCWTFGPLLAMAPVRELGSLRFGRVRLLAATLVLALFTTLTGSWHAMPEESFWRLVLSGLVGFALGDWVLFAGIRILGPRRGGLIYAANAPFTAMLGMVILGETMTLGLALGTLLVFGGVAIALSLRNREPGRMETVQGSVAVGVGLCLLAALAQAGGTILARPAMAAGADPLAAATLRAGVSAALFVVIATAQGRLSEYVLPRRLLMPTVLHACIGPGLGAALMMLAVAHATAGVAAVLSSLSPVLILPVLRLGFGERLHPGCWLGAATTVAGMAVIFSQ
ncbi:MAG TPA: DMT family transporter [Alphaproteobacteria bacterium]|nr:DMT family transporter [Alphaproteobacteria bacterium]